MWIETNDGWINLDQAAKIEEAPGGGRWLIDRADGTRLGVVKGRYETIREHLAPLVPATPGAVAHEIGFDNNLQEMTDHWRYAVIAWRVHQELREPVLSGTCFVGQGGGDTFWAIENPDGVYEDLPNGGLHNNFEAWVDSARRLAKHRATKAGRA